MSKYINADKIQEVIDWYEHKEIVSDTDLQSAFIDIMNLPSADVVEAKHGKWVGNSFDFYCSNCNQYQNFYAGKSNFCPNCGADMRGEKDA